MFVANYFNVPPKRNSQVRCRRSCFGSSKENGKILYGLLDSRRIIFIGEEDVLMWCMAKSGEYKVNLGYAIQKRCRDTLCPSKLCWDKRVLLKVRAFLRIAFHGRILTGDRLRTIAIAGPNWCPMCKRSEEFAFYLIIWWPMVEECWDWFMDMVEWSSVRSKTFYEFLLSWSLERLKSKWGDLWLVGMLAAIKKEN
ncbi:hypothetical protein SUGI_0324040 [Cryptomeria japonica]|nr:hypothetical protein SUGI_0324040 [Cryptomeria japonica]